LPISPPATVFEKLRQAVMFTVFVLETVPEPVAAPAVVEAAALSFPP
jgi:hypothetical protein